MADVKVQREKEHAFMWLLYHNSNRTILLSLLKTKNTEKKEKLLI